MHLSVKACRITGTGTKDKIAAMGILERGGKVKTIGVANRKKTALPSEVTKHVEAGAALYTDALLSYSAWLSSMPTELWITPSKSLQRSLYAASQILATIPPLKLHLLDGTMWSRSLREAMKQPSNSSLRPPVYTSAVSTEFPPEST